MIEKFVDTLYVRDSGNGKRERVVVDMTDINIIRIESKLESMFEGKIDTSDLDEKKRLLR